ncbi:MAG TPA: Uma2 family endonuclease [Kofleriaceae bacterium]|nr:Uma2 family endonuclease [Kofleriaceae bacterium]
MFVPSPTRGISRLEYDRLVERGHLVGEPIELLRGRLVTVMPQGTLHGNLVAWLGRELTLALGRGYMVRQQLPFAATDDSEPEPDIAVTRDDPDRRSHPSTALLVIEVADSSLDHDREEKSSIYAQANVPEYWIVDVKARAVDVLTHPAPDGYLRAARLGRGDVLRPTLLTGIELAVADLPWGE